MKQDQYIQNLTPLRGIAALLVIIFHADLFMKADTGILVAHSSSGFIQKGYLMVDFFFILSGFIMAHVYFSDFARRVKARPYKNFLTARLARIYPLHFVTFLWMVVIFALLYFTGNYKPDPISSLVNNISALPSQLFLLHAMHLHDFTTWNGPSWSISVEWWMYVLFPFLVPFIARSGTAVKILLALLAWGGMWWIVLYLNPAFPLPLPFPIPPQFSLDVTTDFGFLRCLFGFIIGVLTHHLYSARWGMTMFGNSLFFLTVALTGAVLMHFNVYDTFTVLVFPLIILSAAHIQSGLISRLFTSRPLQYLGDLSYSIYLTHLPVWATVWSIIQVFFPEAVPQLSPLNAWIICIAWIILTIFVSGITYRFIEVPGRQWVKSLTQKRARMVTQSV